MSNRERSALNLDLNTDNFCRYLEENFNIDFANLICFDLNLFVPLSFISLQTQDDLKKHIDNRAQKLTDRSLAIFYYEDENSKWKMNDSTVLVIDSLRDDIIRLFKRKKSKSSGRYRYWIRCLFLSLPYKIIFSDSTDTTNNENNTQKSRKRKSSNSADMKEFSMERRKRQVVFNIFE